MFPMLVNVVFADFNCKVSPYNISTPGGSKTNLNKARCTSDTMLN